ncbi:MAG: glycosyltransferase [Halieaceae bacterium]|uniref:glycosyltransferase family 2 protein n=1 Tax=Haliea alexandrii TaxID=2448162 RepID=UPI000F0BBC94|nr:glycosyltransferase [Haliea alexandrii]MCR9186499.1 glycosyltransferase [Halieaceae bacterium]
MPPDVTLCITPRERFSCAVASLEDIIRNTSTGYALVYIDAKSPASIARELKQLCTEHGFTYVRHDHYLAPNQARNMALEHCTTRYAVFADNDLFVTQGWLEGLLDCARSTGAWAVSPVILEGGTTPQVIHMAGGELSEHRSDGYNAVHQSHRYMLHALRTVRSELVREAVGMFEFHCVLLDRQAFAETCFLDEAFLSHHEHLDLAREIRLAGGQVFFEPTSVVRYDNASPFQPCDREFFELRWCLEWTESSLEHARRKWHLAPGDAGLERAARWTEKHRRLFESTQKAWSARVLPIVVRRALRRWVQNIKSKPASARP